MSEHPFLADEFRIPWSQLTPDRVEPGINAAIEEAKTNLETICAVAPGTETYANTFEAFDSATEALNRGWGRLNHLDSVRNSPEQRAALNKMLPVVSAFSAGIPRASHPIGCSTLNPLMILKRLITSPMA